MIKAKICEILTHKLTETLFLQIADQSKWVVDYLAIRRSSASFYFLQTLYIYSLKNLQWQKAEYLGNYNRNELFAWVPNDQKKGTKWSKMFRYEMNIIHRIYARIENDQKWQGTKCLGFHNRWNSDVTTNCLQSFYQEMLHQIQALLSFPVSCAVVQLQNPPNSILWQLWDMVTHQMCRYFTIRVYESRQDRQSLILQGMYRL